MWRCRSSHRRRRRHRCNTRRCSRPRLPCRSTHCTFEFCCGADVRHAILTGRAVVDADTSAARLAVLADDRRRDTLSCDARENQARVKRRDAVGHIVTAFTTGAVTATPLTFWTVRQRGAAETGGNTDAVAALLRHGVATVRAALECS